MKNGAGVQRIEYEIEGGAARLVLELIGVRRIKARQERRIRAALEAAFDDGLSDALTPTDEPVLEAGLVVPAKTRA